MFCLLLVDREKGREAEKEGEGRQGRGFLSPQGGASLAGCVVWDFPCC
jgi:hypothetical protein